MIRFWAITENTIREGIANKVIVSLFVLITIIIGFFLLALSIGGDVLYLFGAGLDGLPDEMLRKFEAAVTGFFYQIALFIGIFAIASFYPKMQEKGTIDLVLSRPMSRFSIYTAKFIGCMTVVFMVMSYLVLGSWAVFWLKTGIAHIEYLSTIPIFMIIFLAFMAFISMVGIVFRNTTLSAILAIFFPFIFSAIFFGFHESGVLKGHKFWHGFFETLYWVFPKTLDLSRWNLRLIGGRALGDFDPGMAIWTTLAFAAFCYLIGVIIFQKRSY